MAKHLLARRSSSKLKMVKAYLRRAGGHVKRVFTESSIDPATASFIQHNRKTWARGSEGKSTSEVLVDRFGIPQTVIAQSYTANVLAAKHNACIKTFSAQKRMSRRLQKVYASFNTESHITPELGGRHKEQARRIAEDARPRIHSKRDLLDLSILEIHVGTDLYETYLMRFREPTVNLQDARLYHLIEEAAIRLSFWTEYFTTHRVAAVINSHDNYLEFNSVNKVAYRFGVPVYLPNLRGIWKIERPFSLYEYFPHYRSMFRALPEREQASGLALAQMQIEKRLRGEVGVDMPYSTKSAFQAPTGARPILRQSNNLKVLICTHCFYDNPYAYGPILFEDFYEWLMYLGEISNVTNYDWYLKMHPDPLPGTEKVVRRILNKFPRITMVPYDTSHHQLVAEGINYVLTVYGSVGHEYPALGIPVINAGYNPHVAYDFTWNPTSLAEYERWLMDLGSLQKRIDLKDVSEFYFMHYYYTRRDDFFLRSFQKFIETVDPRAQHGSEAYAYFLSELTEERHGEILGNVKAFIESGKTFPFEYDAGVCRSPRETLSRQS